MFVLSVYYHSHFIFRILFTFLYAVGEYKSRHKKEGPIFTLRKASRWASCVKEYSKDLLVSSSHRWGWGPLDHWVKLVCCVVYIGPGPNELMGLILSGRPAVTEDALQRWALRSPDKGERDLWGGKLDCEEMEYRKLKDLVFIFRIFENVEIDIFLLLFDVWIFSFTASLSGTEFEFVLIQFDGICMIWSVFTQFLICLAFRLSNFRLKYSPGLSIESCFLIDLTTGKLILFEKPLLHFVNCLQLEIVEFWFQWVCVHLVWSNMFISCWIMAVVCEIKS